MKLTNEYFDEQISQLTGKIVGGDIRITISRTENIDTWVQLVAPRVDAAFGT